MRDQVNLQMLLKRLLSSTQQRLFKHQRQLLAQTTKTRSLRSMSESSSEEDVRAMKRLPKTRRLMQTLQKFKAESDFDKRLLLGVVVADIEKHLKQ